VGDGGDANVGERRELATPPPDFLRVDRRRHDPLPFAGVSDHVAMGADDDTAAVVAEPRVGSAAVHSHHGRLILDRPGLEEREPVVDPTHRPVGDDDEQFGALSRGRPKMLGEAEVVADERGDPEPAPREVDGLLPSHVGGRLTAE
jgi:hypothetical protein